jgi:hypothetical protein
MTNAAHTPPATTSSHGISGISTIMRPNANAQGRPIDPD